MGNEAIARGAIEAGLHFCAAYPGSPSSEIMAALSRVAPRFGHYTEWSTNEKVALEVSFAASIAGLRAICAMKQNGVNVASDFLLHVALSGTRGGIVLVHCDDPGALSSINEGESRHFAKMIEPLRNEQIIITHVTQRTGLGEAQKILRAKLPAEQYGRIRFLMDRKWRKKEES